MTIQNMPILPFVRLLMEGIGWVSATTTAAMVTFYVLLKCHEFVQEQYETLRLRARRLDADRLRDDL